MTGREGIVHRRPAASPALDPCTNSNYYHFTVVNTELDITADFDSKTVAGTVTFTLQAHLNQPALILDTSYLEIQKVLVEGKLVKYELKERSEPFGSPLHIPLQSVETSAGNFKVEVVFSTTDKCTALQFIDGDTGPYLFSQCQAIHARSLFPCFDTPGSKSPYTYRVKSPSKVLMSGLPEKSGEAGEYIFRQPIPIPSYLVAIASGNLVSAAIGPRSDVYSEEPQISQCQWEFEQDMEDFLQVAEKLAFDYEWTKFDVLVLPLSFPYGGMENPNMTFATPTLLCKDRSQVRVLAHELAHSWAGNLVTNCSWEHFWLNEGWTVYFERRILGAVASLKAQREGRKDYDDYGEKIRHFAAYSGYSELAKSIDDLEEKTTTLIWNLEGSDPDDFYSRIPYEKGFNFLFYLEQKLGGREEFDGFIPYYFKKFRYLSIDSFQFLDCLYEYFVPKGKEEVLESIDFDHWFYSPGLPEYQNFDTTLVDECTSLADKWVAAIESNHLDGLDKKDIASFDANQHVLFLVDLSQKLDGSDNPELIRAMADIFPLYSLSENFEIIFNFSSLLIRYGNYSENDQVVQKFAQWLHTVGRMKYVRPGYRLLEKYISRDFAVKTFKAHGKYHPICKSLVQKDLGLE